MGDWQRIQLRLSKEAIEFLAKEATPRKQGEKVSEILEQCARGELVPATQAKGYGLLERVEDLLRQVGAGSSAVTTTDTKQAHVKPVL